MIELRNYVLAGVLGGGLLVASGCRQAHLGEDTGVTYRKAMAAQRESDGKGPSGLDSADARRVLVQHRRGDKGERKGAVSNRNKGSITLEKR